ncbi:DNA cytosine methyltransferase [Microbispora tritici]|uniref:DNA (cytosine-5-)-methyltransferase n=2 Tax=Microbispora TaxID=2005 RepID=A0ABY3LRQ1_9ACTN|nr:DNA cytosine methyltransferase [Microbispora fusca]TYB51299.1 DNA cytosine methyltransferase [Microbispora tritici]
MIDLFAGPGGLDVAATWLGIPVIGIEWDANACATRRAAGLLTEQGDVRAFEPRRFSNANVLAAGPPCQTFTVAGSGHGRKALDEVLLFVRRMGDGDDVTEDLNQIQDERTALVLEPLRWALKAIENGNPYRAIVLEQVPAALPVWEAVGAVLISRGYHVAHGILHTEQYGVPQTRRRAVLIARLGADATLPKPTHRPFRRGMSRTDGTEKLLPWIAMGDVLNRPIPFVVVSNYGTGGDPKARGRRMSAEPSFTVTGKIFRNRVVTPSGNALPRFSYAEAGRLQTFPSDYPWVGSDVAQQIGNAIPPLLAMHVLVAALDIDAQILEQRAAENLPLWSETKVPHF